MKRNLRIEITAVRRRIRIARSGPNPNFDSSLNPTFDAPPEGDGRLNEARDEGTKTEFDENKITKTNQ